MNWHVSPRPTRWAVTLATAIALAAFAATCLAPRLAARADEAAERKIIEALDESTTLEFIETPLVDVLSYLEDVHEIEIQIDRHSPIGKAVSRFLLPVIIFSSHAAIPLHSSPQSGDEAFGEGPGRVVSRVVAARR